MSRFVIKINKYICTKQINNNSTICYRTKGEEEKKPSADNRKGPGNHFQLEPYNMNFRGINYSSVNKMCLGNTVVVCKLVESRRVNCER